MPVGNAVCRRSRRHVVLPVSRTPLIGCRVCCYLGAGAINRRPVGAVCTRLNVLCAEPNLRVSSGRRSPVGARASSCVTHIRASTSLRRGPKGLKIDYLTKRGGVRREGKAKGSCPCTESRVFRSCVYATELRGTTTGFIIVEVCGSREETASFACLYTLVECYIQRKNIHGGRH